jgi:molybdopterin synthase sulfur carrier subunit
MINIQYFASLRESLATDKEAIEWQAELASVTQLKDFLGKRGTEWQSVMINPSTQTAINHQVANNDTQIADGDEVAFFPPVTGG